MHKIFHEHHSIPADKRPPIVRLHLHRTQVQVFVVFHSWMVPYGVDVELGVGVTSASIPHCGQVARYGSVKP